MNCCKSAQSNVRGPYIRATPGEETASQEASQGGFYLMMWPGPKFWPRAHNRQTWPCSWSESS